MACFHLSKVFRVFIILAFTANCTMASASDIFHSVKENIHFQDTIPSLMQIRQQSRGFNKNDEIDYISSFLFLQSLNPTKFDSATKSQFYSQLSVYYSYLGANRVAVQYEDSSIVYRPYNSFYNPKKDDTTFLDKVEFVDAHATLISTAVKSRIFIIGEEHHSSPTRVFTTSLLEDLFKAGYRYLALEALDPKVIFSANEKLNIKMPGSGVYILEPGMANLIRYAHKLGFTVMGYDCAECKTYKEREETSGSRLSKIFKTDSTAKMVIHVGYAHSAKNLPKGLLWSVAQVIWDSTGIEPVTVAQHEISEGYINSYKNFFYNYLIPKVKEPAILYMNGKPLDLSGIHMYDFSIITNSYNHYFQDEMNKRIGLKKFSVKLSKAELQNGFLLQILPLEEAESYGTEHVVPCYQRLIKDKAEFTGALLPGKYVVLVRDKSNIVISNKKLIIIKE